MDLAYAYASVTQFMDPGPGHVITYTYQSWQPLIVIGLHLKKMPDRHTCNLANLIGCIAMYFHFKIAPQGKRENLKTGGGVGADKRRCSLDTLNCYSCSTMIYSNARWSHIELH